MELSEILGTWTVARIDDQLADPAVRSTVEFAEDGRVRGNGGVNGFGGQFEYEAGQIEFSAMRTTLMAGPQAAMAQEAAVLTRLSGRRPITLDGDRLTVGDLELERGPSPRTVRGSVFYRERIALPAGAIVTVQLLDVSRADAPSTTLAEVVLRPERQVPIPFSLEVDPSAFVAGHRYAVAARIEVDGRLRWTTDTAHPVEPARLDDELNVLVVGVQPEPPASV